MEAFSQTGGRTKSMPASNKENEKQKLKFNLRY